jgi:hypothetical protein
VSGECARCARAVSDEERHGEWNGERIASRETA